MGQTFYENMIVGVVAAVLLSGLTWCLAMVRDMLVRRRFPVAGQYASEYEDHVDGRVVKTKAITIFHQRGRRIWGTADNIADSRAWHLEGRVGRAGRVFGTYDSVDPHDEGLGGFFLELRSDGSLEGMWSGYDSVNRTVEAGRYRFWPIQQLDVTLMQSNDVPQSLALLGEALGHRYITAEGLRAFARQANGLCAYVATTSDGTIIGAATGQVTQFVELDGCMPLGSGRHVRGALPELEFHRIGILKSIAVSPGARGRGVATRLTQEVTDRLWFEGATCVITIGWSDEDGCHIQGVVEGLGYTQATTLEGFWTEDSKVNQYDCPTCGNPCLCSAIVFVAKRTDYNREARVS